MTEFGGKGTAV